MEEKRGMGEELREISKAWRRDSRIEEPATRREDFEGLRHRLFAADHSAMTARSLFRLEEADKASAGGKERRRVTSSAYIKSCEERETDGKSETKMLKRRGPRMEP